MADFGAPATSNINYQPGDGLKTIGDIMSLKQKQQALQSGQLEIQKQRQALPGQAADVQVKQQDASQRSAAAKFYENFDASKHMGPDGTLDLDSAMSSPEVKGLGDSKPEVMKSLLDIKQHQLQSKTALSGLNKDLVTQFGQSMQSLAKDPDVIADKTDPKTGINAGRAKVDQFLGNFSKLSPDAQRVAGIYSPITQHAPPGKLASGVQAMALQGQDISSQQAQTNPDAVVVNDGTATRFGTRDKASGAVAMGSGPPIANQLTPQDRLPRLTTNAAGQAVAIDPTNPNRAGIVGSGRAPTAGGGGPAGAPAAPGPARPGARPGTGPMSVPPAQDVNPTSANVAATMDNTKVASQNIEQARQVGDQAPLNQHINDQLLKLSEDTSTGYGTKDWHKAIGAISGGKFGGDYQTIGAYLDRQSAMAAKSMGLPDTNAGLATASSATGTTEYSKEALQTKVKLADSLNTASKQFRQGLDRVVGVNGNPDTTKYQQFRAAWSQNFDPQVFAAENAIRRGDTKELAKIKQQEGPAGMAALAQKRQALNALSAGQIPQ